MMRKFSEDEMWELVGYIKVSQTRYLTLKTLDSDFLMPSEIAKSTGLRTTQISNALRDLKERDLVICLNESARKGRIYQNTPLAMEILKRIDK